MRAVLSIDGLIRLGTDSGCDLVCAVMSREPTRRRGLSGWPPLPNGAGMLFDFGRPTRVTFWMSDVSFPIDIAMIDENGVVMNVWRDCRPGSDERFPGVARWVLETTAGAGPVPGDRVFVRQDTYPPDEIGEDAVLGLLRAEWNRAARGAR